MQVNPLKSVLCGVALTGSLLLLSGCGGPSNEQLGTPKTAEEARQRSLENNPYAKGGPPRPGNMPSNQGRPGYPQGQR